LPPRRLARELTGRDSETVRIAGHLQDYRALGGVAFALVRDGSGVVQVTLKKGVAEPALFEAFAAIPRESVVEVEGTVRASPKANSGVEVAPLKLTVVSTSEVPLPLGVVDKVNVELDTRLNHRVLDLRKPEVRRVFELRSHFLQALRQSYVARGFLEVETPKLLRQGAEGGATLFSIGYFEDRAFLAQSPQLYKQMLMSAGFERIFEIAPAFRAERSDTVKHMTEFTSVDAEMAYIDGPGDLLTTLEGIVHDATETARSTLKTAGNALADGIPEAKLPFPRYPFRDLVRTLGRSGPEVDLTTEEEKRAGEIIVRESGNPYYFITDFPSEVKRTTFYARRRDDDPSLTMYFDLYHSGLELASGGPREHRLDRLTQNILDAGLRPESFPGYLEAFRFGMPTHGGWGFGMDRWTKELGALPNVRESRLFPRDQYRLDP
jgi:nondiscriminating aspartyl-tRNA synthetase